MSYEKCPSISINVKKEEINVTSYPNNVFPATPSRWSVSGENFRDKIENLLNMYMGGELQLLPSNNTNTAFALRLTRDYLTLLADEKLTIGDYSRYNMIKPLERALDSNTFSIALTKIFREHLQGKNADEKHEDLKTLNAYEDYVKSFENYYKFYNNVIVENIIDFFLKVVNKKYNETFDEKRFKTHLELNGQTFVGVKIKQTKCHYKFKPDFEYKTLKDAYYSDFDTYNFKTKIQTDSGKILRNDEILQMISGISDEKQKEYHDTYNKLSNNLKSSVNNMLKELKNNQKVLE